MDLSKNFPHPGLGHFVVHGHIVIAAVQYGLHGRQGAGCPVDKHRHRPVDALDRFGKERAEPPGLIPHLGKGHGRGFIGERRLAAASGRGGIQIFQHIFLQHGTTPLFDR